MADIPVWSTLAYSSCCIYRIFRTVNCFTVIFSVTSGPKFSAKIRCNRLFQTAWRDRIVQCQFEMKVLFLFKRFVLRPSGSTVSTFCRYDERHTKLRHFRSQFSSIPLLRRTRRFFKIGGRNHRQYSLRLPTEGWRGWVGLSGMDKHRDSRPANSRHEGGRLSH